MAEGLPPLEPPTREEVRAAAAAHHLELDDEAVAAYAAAVADELDRYRRIERLPDPAGDGPPTGRDPGYRPDREEDPLNAFVTRCAVAGSGDGPLAGVSVGIKDSIAVAGVEMTAGSRLFEGYVPTRDATVVTRLLEAGATVAGKTNMDDLAASGTGDLALGGPTLNPVDPAYVSGGSSGGSAAAVAAGEVDLAIGTDQAGSVRVPAAWCGCVGLKPTHGLVPYTGTVQSGPTYDHLGPLTRSVPECALALEVVAGPDSLDPRQEPHDPPAYADELGASPVDVAVGVVPEGFGHGEDAVDGAVREALSAFADAGASVRERSVPWHEHGRAIRGVVGNEESTALSRAEGQGHYHAGAYDLDLLLHYAAARRRAPEEFPPTVKAKLIKGQYAMDKYRGYYHAKAQRLRRRLAEAYDEALEGVDVLAMPTVPSTPLPAIDIESPRDALERKGSGGRTVNTAPFDVSGHPAVSVPCGTVEGLPVGLMFVGERFDDAGVLRAADAFERGVGEDGSPAG